MRNPAQWRPTKFELHRGRLRGSRDPRELGIGSRLISDLVAARYQAHLPGHASGALLDLGCGKVPLYAAYAPHVGEITCVAWAAGEHIDQKTASDPFLRWIESNARAGAAQRCRSSSTCSR